MFVKHFSAFPRPMVFYSPDDLGGAQGTDPTNPDGTPPGNPPNADSRFTQSDVDAIVKKRLTAERTRQEREKADLAAQAVAEFRADNGLDDDVIQKLSETDKTAMEIRKMKSSTTKLTNQLTETQTKLELVTSKLNETLTSTALLKVAAAKSPHPSQVLLNLKNKVAYDENYNVYVKDGEGLPSNESIESLVDNFLMEHKYLANPIANGQGSGSAAPNPNSSGTPVTDFSNQETRVAHLKNSSFGGG